MRGQSLKRAVSRSPVDLLFAPTSKRQRTFLCTFAPEEEQIPMLSEMVNLFQSDPARVSNPPFSLARPVLEAFSKEAQEAHRNRKNPELSEEERGMLRDLGYISP